MTKAAKSNSATSRCRSKNRCCCRAVSQNPTKRRKSRNSTNPPTKSRSAKAAQNVPGGLAGIVPEASSPPLVKALIKFFFENKITGLTSTLELAKPASEIKMSESNLARREGVALKMPVKVHLENPFLGKSCYVGSSSSPIWWELTTWQNHPAGAQHLDRRRLGQTRIHRRRPDPEAERQQTGRQRLVGTRAPRAAEESSASSSTRSSTPSSAPLRPATTRRSSTTRSISPRRSRWNTSKKKTPKRNCERRLRR